MNREDLSDLLPLQPEVKDILDTVTELTGKDIFFKIDETMPYDAITKIARQRMPEHIIILKQTPEMRTNHLIAHECGHIIRLMIAPAEKRVIPVTESSLLKEAYSKLSDELNVIPENIRTQAFQMWVNGLIMQLTNLPVDTRIERWLYNKYPSFRKTQLESIKEDVIKSLNGLSKKMEENIIPTIFHKSNSMIFAYLKILGHITGEKYKHHFKKHPSIIADGKKLLPYLEKDDEGFLQDLEIINSWAKVMSIDDWFTWIGFEDVPESYYS